MVPLKEQAGPAYTTIEHCGNSGDVFFIDYSMQFGYLVDVGLFLPAACLLVVLPSLLSCGLTLEFVFSHGLPMSTLMVCT